MAKQMKIEETPQVQTNEVKLSPRQSAIQTLTSQFSSYEKKVLPDLLEKHGISPSQFVQIVLSEIKKNEKLLQAFMENPSSMFASILAGAEVGLIPSDMLGEFYLIPRNMKQSDGKFKLSVTPLIGYKGLVNILLRSGDITRIHTEVVYEGDEFTPIYGLEPNIIHKPNFNVPRNASTIRYAYAVAKMKSGEYQFAVMTRGEIEGVRSMSKYENDLYFNDKMGINRWMERKCVLIQLSKMLPKDYYSKKAISMDGMMDGGAMLTLDDNNQIKVVEGTPIKPARFRNIYGTLNAPQTEKNETDFYEINSSLSDDTKTDFYEINPSVA
jgi:recombination protein RecT